MLTRRAFVAAPLLGRLATDSIHTETAVQLPGGVFRCPVLRARILAVLRLRAMDVTAIAFACDFHRNRQDLLVLIAPTGHLLALERLTWSSPDSASLTTRPSMLPDQTHIALARSAARKPEGIWKRETWTDYLRLDGATLTNAPPRPVAPNTWQAALSAERAEIAASLPPDAHIIPPETLARLRRAPLD